MKTMSGQAASQLETCCAGITENNTSCRRASLENCAKVTHNWKICPANMDGAEALMQTKMWRCIGERVAMRESLGGIDYQ